MIQRWVYALLACLALTPVAFAWEPGFRFGRAPFLLPVAAAQDAGRPPVLRSDKVFSVDMSYSASGIMGDIGDVAIGLGEKGVQRFTYVPRGRRPHEWDYKYLDGKLNPDPARQGGVMWLSPANDWGESQRCGFDLRKLKPNVIRWDARCEGDSVKVGFVIGGVNWKWSQSDKLGWIKTKVPYRDTIPVTQLGIKKLSNEWASFECQLPDSYDFSRVAGGFGWTITWDANGIESVKNDKTFVFEVRNVRYEVATGLPKPSDDVFYVYRDADSGDNHFKPTGYMGDCGDIRVDEAWEKNPQAGKTCIRIVYEAKGKPPHRCPYAGPCKWSGLYWQYPPNNWGEHEFWKGQGYDLSNYTRLAFWARSEKKCTLEFMVAGIDGAYGDSQTQAVKQAFDLTPTWKQFEIDCKGTNLKHTIAGLGWATNWDTNPDGATFYLDEIRFLKK